MEEKLINKIISAAYGEAPLRDRLLIIWQARRNAEVKELYAAYKNTAELVHSMEEEKCPECVTDRAIDLTLKDKVKTRSFLLDVYTAFFAKPLWPAAMVTLIISVISVSIFLKQDEELRRFNPQQKIEDLREAEALRPAEAGKTGEVPGQETTLKQDGAIKPDGAVRRSGGAIKQNRASAAFTQKDIEQASEQASMALKMVGDILNGAKTAVIKEILPEKVSEPINKSLTEIKKLFDKESINEKVN